jgi:hypothetical protein
MTTFSACSRNVFMAGALSLMLVACSGEGPSYHGQAAQALPLDLRVANLERDISQIRNDLSQLAMNYNGVMVTNERIDALIAHMEEQQRAAPMPVVEKIEPVQPVKDKTESASAARAAPKPVIKPVATTALTVKGVRIGEHTDMTRLVIDWTGLGAVKADLDNSEKLLLVTLSDTEWDAKKIVSGLSSPLVSGWSVDENGNRKILAIRLKKPVTLKSLDKIAPARDQSARVVIDLSGA